MTAWKKDESLGRLGRSGCVKETSGCDEFFLRELKAGIFKLQDLRTSEVGTKLDRPVTWARLKVVLGQQRICRPIYDVNL